MSLLRSIQPRAPGRCWPPTRAFHHAARPSTKPCSKQRASTGRQQYPVGTADKNNPDLDELVLDEEYYREFGMTAADVERERMQVVTDADPEAVAATSLDDLASVQDDILPEGLRQRIESLEVYGPPVSTTAAA
eukprot:jgi/Chrzof1/2763/Cz11g28110.t1